MILHIFVCQRGCHGQSITPDTGSDVRHTERQSGPVLFVDESRHFVGFRILGCCHVKKETHQFNIPRQSKIITSMQQQQQQANMNDVSVGLRSSHSSTLSDLKWFYCTCQFVSIFSSFPLVYLLVFFSCVMQLVVDSLYLFMETQLKTLLAITTDSTTKGHHLQTEYRRQESYPKSKVSQMYSGGGWQYTPHPQPPLPWWWATVYIVSVVSCASNLGCVLSRVCILHDQSPIGSVMTKAISIETALLPPSLQNDQHLSAAPLVLIPCLIDAVTN